MSGAAYAMLHETASSLTAFTAAGLGAIWIHGWFRREMRILGQSERLSG